jgi:hypothetical protein
MARLLFIDAFKSPGVAASIGTEQYHCRARLLESGARLAFQHFPWAVDTTDGLGYWKVGLDWPYNISPGHLGGCNL